MEELKIAKECIVEMMNEKYMKVFDFRYEEGRHYYNATRRPMEKLVATMEEDEMKSMLPDAVTVFLILDIKGREPVLYLANEYRYPVGRSILCPPAGLMDPGDADEEFPLIATAVREIREETGIEVKKSDRIFVVNPLAFSSPGMTDESNALVCAVVSLDSLDSLTQSGAEITERFDGYRLIDRDEARKLLSDGRNEDGRFYSMYTWSALMYFLSDMWREE